MESFGQSLSELLVCTSEAHCELPQGGFLSPPVFFFYCANTFLLHRQAGMLTHKPCKEFKVGASRQQKKNIGVVVKFLPKCETLIKLVLKKQKSQIKQLTSGMFLSDMKKYNSNF